MAAFAAIGITTADMRESVRFYRLLGVEVADADGDHLSAELPGGVRLMWDTVELIKQIDPEWTQPVGNPITLAFECDAPAAVDDLHARVVAAGFRSKREPWDAFWGQRYAYLFDPDGNEVALFAAL